MKKFFKQSTYFYGVVIFLICCLFIGIGDIDKLSKVQLNKLGGFLGYAAIAIVLLTISLCLRTHQFKQVKNGIYKSIEDKHYIGFNLWVEGAGFLGLVNVVCTLVLGLPKLYKVMDCSFSSLIGGKTDAGYLVLGTILILATFIYEWFTTRLLEEDLPRRRRATRKASEVTEKVWVAFAPHYATFVGIYLFARVLLHIKNM